MNLMALGAGLGQFAQQYQQQQDAAIRQQMLALTLAKFQQEMQAQRAAQEASSLITGFDMGGGQPRQPQALPGTSAPGLPATMPPGANPLSFVGQLANAASQPQRTQPGSAFEGQNTGYPFPTQGATPGFPALPANTTGDAGQVGAGFPFNPTPPRDNIPPNRSGAPPPVPLNGTGALTTPEQATSVAASMTGASPPGATTQVAQAPTAPPELPPSPRDIMLILRKNSPTASSAALSSAAAEIHKRLQGDYKLQFEQWKATQSLGGDAASRAETARANRARETHEAQKIGLEEKGLNEKIAAGTATRADMQRQRELEQGRLDAQNRQIGIGERQGDARIGNAAERTRAAIGKTQGKTDLALSELETLIREARTLAGMIEADPTLVGSPGIARRGAGAVSDVLGAVTGTEDPLKTKNPASSDFKSKLQLLQSRLAKPLLDARYFSGPAQQRLNQIIPGLAAMDSPTAVRQALSNVADTLEQTAAATRAAQGSVSQDLSKATDEELLKTLGIGNE